MFVRDSQSGHPDSEHRQRIAPNAARFCAYTSGHRQCGTGWQCQGKGENAEKELRKDVACGCPIKDETK
jgi:hypothetical protein